MNILLMILGAIIALLCTGFGITSGSVVGILLVAVGLFRIGYKCALKVTGADKRRQYGMR